MAIRQHGSEPVPPREAERFESCCEPRRALAQGVVRQSDLAVDQCLTVRVALCRVDQAEREIHEVPATWTIASTIGS